MYNPGATTHSNGLLLRTLGAASLNATGEMQPRLTAGKGLGLLVLLALTPGKRVSRDALIEMLWSDVHPDRARNALRQALWSLRRTLGDEAIVGTSELQLAREIISDRDTFLAHVVAGNLESAIEVYGGPFLPSFGVPGGAAFEQWADLERSKLETTYTLTAELLVGRLLEQGRARDALAIARAVRERAPESEVARRLVLQTAVMSRDVVTASVEADAMTRWAAELDHPLELSTRRALSAARQLLASSPAEVEEDDGARPLVSDLIGREAEFALIVRAWEQTRHGSASTVRIEAPPGFGKSRLLRDIGERLRQRGALMVSVGGGPADRDLPYAFLGDLASVLSACRGASGIAPGSAATLVALNPALSSRFPVTPDAATGPEVVTRRVHALGDLLQAIADEQPVALCIDDLHWIDAGSRQVLDGLLTRLQDSRVLVCVAGRPEAHRPPATDHSLHLPPLSPAQVRDLITSIGTLPVMPWAERFVAGVVKAGSGSPLLVLETLRLLLDRGAVHLDDGTWHCDSESALLVLLTAGEAVRERVRATSPLSRDLLVLMSLHGAALAIDQLTAAVNMNANGTDIDATAASALLHELERQGLVVSSATGFGVAHDEIARVVLEDTTSAQRAQLAAHLGAILLASRTLDAVTERRAARHLVAAGHDERLGRAFRSVVERARWRGDHRAHRVLASEWLGTDVEPAVVSRVVALLPLTWRLGLWSGPRQLLAIALLALVGATGWDTWQSSAARRSASPQLIFADTSHRAWAVRVNDALWASTPAVVSLTPAQPTSLPVALASTERSPAISPDGRSIAWNVLSADSTTIDIWLRTPEGTRRLTRRVRDDVVIEWLPDGSGLVGLSNQWSPKQLGSYDVAIIDTARGAATPLTRGPEHEGAPHVSPDGLRIAFSRETDGGDRTLCVVSRFATADEPARCQLVQGVSVNQVIGWVSSNEVVTVVDSGVVQPLVRVDVDRGVAATLKRGFVLGAQVSPDRKWLYATMSVDRMVGVREWIIPLAAPQQARQVLAPHPLRRHAWWQGVMDTSDVVRRLVLTDRTSSDSVSTVVQGVRSLLRVQALAGDGRAVPLPIPVRWESSDSTIAVVDTSGEVRGLRRGTVVITARLSRTTKDVGPTRRPPLLWAQRVVRVDAVPLQPLTTEDWRGDWRSRWIVFGEPAPSVSGTGDGLPTLMPNGDGVYHSIALQRAAFPGVGGLGAELRLSTPITRPTWQFARVGLVAVGDTASLVRAAPGGPAPAVDGAQVSCGMVYPAPGMKHFTRRLIVQGGIVAWLDLGALGDSLATGRWWTLRLQLLPDGRCGVAVNGRVLWVSPEALDVRLPRRLRLGDESVGTTMRYGPLRVWRGVMPDVDWAR